MSDNAERHNGHGWLWILWTLAAAVAGLVVYAKMKPETEIGKHVNGLCDSLWGALRRACPMCHQDEAQAESPPEAAPLSSGS
jgi:hypothetical protein